MVYKVIQAKLDIFTCDWCSKELDDVKMIMLFDKDEHHFCNTECCFHWVLNHYSPDYINNMIDRGGNN